MGSFIGKTSVVIISKRVGKSPEDITYPFVFEEAYRLALRGLKVHVVRSKFEGESLSYGIYFHGLRRKLDVRVLSGFLRNIAVYPPVSLFRSPKSIYRENLYALNVVRVVRENEVDLIHAHFAYPEGLVGLLAKRETGKPLIVTLHGYDILTEPSVGYGIRLNKKYDCLVRRVINNADAVLVASRAVFREAVSMVDDFSKVYLIPNAVDIKRFNPNIDGYDLKKKLGIDGCFVVFTLRSHEPKYGIEYLIRAAPLVLSRMKNVFFVIGGDGSLRKYHEELTVKLGVKDRVIFTGRIPQSELPYYYAMSDVIVVPSVQEAFGLVVTEAMACGKPVVGTRVGGIPDQIINGYNGFLVNPRSPSEIAEKIIWLIDNPEEAKRMGMNGRKLVEEKFDIEKRIKQIISLYEKILGSR